MSNPNEQMRQHAIQRILDYAQRLHRLDNEGKDPSRAALAHQIQAVSIVLDGLSAAVLSLNQLEEEIKRREAEQETKKEDAPDKQPDRCYLCDHKPTWDGDGWILCSHERNNEAQFWKRAAIWMADVHAANLHEAELKVTSKSRRKRFLDIMRSCLLWLEGTGKPTIRRSTADVKDRLIYGITRIEELSK